MCTNIHSKKFGNINPAMDFPPLKITALKGDRDSIRFGGTKIQTARLNSPHHL